LYINKFPNPKEKLLTKISSFIYITGKTYCFT
jgi:hypothetical protein